MKPIVFLVHGMGKHAEGWHESIIDTVDEIVAANKYSYFSSRKVSETIEFVPLGYDKILREAVGRVEDSAALLKSLEPFSDEVGELGEWIENSSEGSKEFIWTHAMDVVLYRLHTPTRQRIRTTLVEKMATKVDQVLQASPNTPVSILAHSLGTAVAHDAAHLLGKHTWGGNPNAFGPRHWRFASITMLANVSRLLATDVAQEDSVIRPGPVDDPSSYCRYFHNYRHEFDPVPWPLPFSSAGFPPLRTDDAPISHFHEPNIHGWGHYLINPRVHVNFLRRIVGDYAAVTSDEEDIALMNFKTWGGRFEPIREKIEEIRTDLPDDLRSVCQAFGNTPSLKNIAAAITLAQKTYDKYAALVEELEAAV